MLKSATQERQSISISALLRNNVGMIFAMVAFVLIAIWVPNFLTVRNIRNLLIQSTVSCFLAAGITPILILGGIDLSLASTMGLSSILGALYMVNTGNVIVGILIMLFTGMLIGLFNGYCISKLGMVPFVVTMSVMIVNTGISTWITRAGSFAGFPTMFLQISKAEFLFIPFPIILVIIFFIGSHLFIKRSYIGRMLYATGVNETAAKICGIKTKRIILISYMVGGIFASLAGVLMSSRMGVAAASLAKESLVMDYISAAVIGGVSIYGGVGSMTGAIIGAIFITVINNSMNLLGVDYQTILITKGLVLILVVAMEKLKKRATD